MSLNNEQLKDQLVTLDQQITILEKYILAHANVLKQAPHEIQFDSNVTQGKTLNGYLSTLKEDVVLAREAFIKFKESMNKVFITNGTLNKECTNCIDLLSKCELKNEKFLFSLSASMNNYLKSFGSAFAESDEIAILKKKLHAIIISDQKISSKDDKSDSAKELAEVRIEVYEAIYPSFFKKAEKVISVLQDEKKTQGLSIKNGVIFPARVQEIRHAYKEKADRVIGSLDQKEAIDKGLEKDQKTEIVKVMRKDDSELDLAVHAMNRERLKSVSKSIQTAHAVDYEKNKTMFSDKSKQAIKDRWNKLSEDDKNTLDRVVRYLVNEDIKSAAKVVVKLPIDVRLSLAMYYDKNSGELPMIKIAMTKPEFLQACKSKDHDFPKP